MTKPLIMYIVLKVGVFVQNTIINYKRNKFINMVYIHVIKPFFLVCS